MIMISTISFENRNHPWMVSTSMNFMI